MQRQPTRLIATCLLTLGLLACGGSTRETVQETGVSPTGSVPTGVTQTGSIPASGPPSATCRDGWTTPAPGTANRTEPLDALRAQLGSDSLFVVDEMRYFTGPDEPSIVAPRADLVHTWYVHVVAEADSSLRGRFIVIRRAGVPNEHAGVLAVAPYDSDGLQPGTWIAFFGGEGDDPASTFPGIPGEWLGIAVDFATGYAWNSSEPVELDKPFFGLPDEVVGCLAGI